MNLETHKHVLMQNQTGLCLPGACLVLHAYMLNVFRVAFSSSCYYYLNPSE